MVFNGVATWWQGNKKSLADKFEYVMHGKLYRISEEGSGKHVKAYVRLTYLIFNSMNMDLYFWMFFPFHWCNTVNLPHLSSFLFQKVGLDWPFLGAHLLRLDLNLIYMTYFQVCLFFFYCVHLWNIIYFLATLLRELCFWAEGPSETTFLPHKGEVRVHPTLPGPHLCDYTRYGVVYCCCLFCGI